jgi:hypothetical protein
MTPEIQARGRLIRLASFGLSFLRFESTRANVKVGKPKTSHNSKGGKASYREAQPPLVLTIKA